MTRCLIVAFHKYQPFGGSFYEPILDFFLAQMKKYEDEYELIYFVDSNWEIDPEKIKDLKATIIRVNPSLTYSDAYKEVLPQVKEDLVLFLDNDFVIYKEGIIRGAFLKLEPSLNNRDTYDVVSIIDEIGEYKTDKLKNGNKFCSYFFATRKELLMKYLDIDWNSHLPHSETLGLLTEAMLNDGVKVWEMEDDKNNLLIGDIDPAYGVLLKYQGSEKGKDLGYYHIRAGSTPAVLLAWKSSPDHQKQYQDYLKNQPKSEYLRQICWYQYMIKSIQDTHQRSLVAWPKNEMLKDMGVNSGNWSNYYPKFKEYHGLN